HSTCSRSTFGTYALGALAVACVLCGCVDWYPRQTETLRTDPGTMPCLVITGDIAYELKKVKVTEAVLRGTIEHVWQLPNDKPDLTALDDLEPDDLARTHGWRPIAQSGTVEIENTKITVLQRREVHHVGLVGGSLLVVLVLVGLVTFGFGQ